VKAQTIGSKWFALFVLALSPGLVHDFQGALF
jgi:hypothetical protein